jgi:hypothetical protein
MILEIRKKDWVDALPSIIETINTTYPSGLPSHITPFKVWFRQKPIWLGITPPTPASGFASSSTATGMSIALVEVDSGDSNKVLSQEDNDLINEDLLEFHRRVFLYNAREAMKMVYKSGEKLTYKVGQIILFAIPLKNRLSAEATCLPCRILMVVKGAYTLLS